MKKILCVFIIGVILMMTGCGATTVVDNQTTHTSLFSWNRELIDNDPYEVMAKLSDYRIDRIYQGLYPTDLENKNTGKLVSGLQDLGIEAVYLTGDPDWNDENVVIEWTIDKLITYNKCVGNGSEIKTICYDAEFYSNDRADEEHFSAYVHMMEKVSKEAHTKGLNVIYCLPYWLPEISESLFKELIAQVDEVSIMNYDVSYETEHLSNIYVWCKEAGVRVESVFETQPADGVGINENNTYYSKGKAALIKAAEELQKQYGGLSIAYHHLSSLLSWN